MSYKVVASERVYRHPLMDVFAETLQDGDRQREYLFLSSPMDAVAILAVTEGGEILVVRQYRHPVGGEVLELPAGRLEPDEAPSDGALREFEEETGFRPLHLELLCRYNQFPSFFRVSTHLYFASDLEATRQRLDEDEELEVLSMPVAEVLASIERGELIDGSLQMGVLLALRKGLLQATGPGADCDGPEGET